MSYETIIYTYKDISVPNHAGNIKDMKYALIRSI